jgi:transposase
LPNSTTVAPGSSSPNIPTHQAAADRSIYTWRHLIENFFCKLKEFERIAMRACKTDQSFEAMIYLVAAVINSR